MNLRTALLATCLLLPAACATTTAPPPAEATFVVVRHGEKAGDDPKDPSLSEAGHARARALAERLADADLVAAYATGFRRTQQTAAPTATAHDVALTIYDAAQPAEQFAAQLKAAHPRGTVLVAGHSNTVPGIVAALCGCAVDEMPETEYDRFNTVHVGSDGQARLEVGRYGAPSPAP